MARILTVILLLAGGLVPGPAAAQTASLAEGRYLVTWVVDGDTVWVQGLDRAIRFAGVSAPEANVVCGAEAKELVGLFAEAGTTIHLEPAEVDFDPGSNRYRAYLRVDVDDQPWTLQELLLMRGLARMDRGRFATERYYDWFDQAERAGRSQHRGIWGSGCAGGVGGDPGRAPPVARDRCPDTHPLKGNATARIYHRPGGLFYDATGPEECFATDEDARTAGYRPSLR